MENRQKAMETPTFLVEIKSCKNKSWQGRLTWIEENRSVYFRSALELLKEMDSAIIQDDENSNH